MRHGQEVKGVRVSACSCLLPGAQAEAEVEQSDLASRQAGLAAAAAASVAEPRGAASPPATPPSPSGHGVQQQQQGGPVRAPAAGVGKTGVPAAEQQPSLADGKTFLQAEVVPPQPWSAGGLKV